MGVQQEQDWGIEEEVWERCASVSPSLHPPNRLKLPSKDGVHLEAPPGSKPCPFPGRPSPSAAHSFQVLHPGSAEDRLPNLSEC